MSDEATSLEAVWMSETASAAEGPQPVIDAVLEKDQQARSRDRRMRLGGLVALALLVPVLVWSAAHGVTALVRIAYALMAIGCAMGAAAELVYLEWSRQSLPGPADTRSQLQRTGFLLDRQLSLAEMAPLWSLPVFIGVGLIGWWLLQNRTASAASVVWAVAGVAWFTLSIFATKLRRALLERRQEIERLLVDF